MNGYGNAGMGMGEGMYGGGASGGRYMMDDFQQQAGMGVPGARSGATNFGFDGAGSANMGMGGGYAGMGGAGMGGFPGAGGMGGFPGMAGRDDELLLSLLRERNQLPGAMPNIYGGSGASGGQSSLLGNLNLNSGGGYDLSSREQGAGLGYPSSYLMDHRSQDLMMRDFQNQGSGIGAGNFLYDQQRQGLQAGQVSAPGMGGFGLSGFDSSAGAGREQQTGQANMLQHEQEQQQPAPPQLKQQQQQQPKQEEEEDDFGDDDESQSQTGKDSAPAVMPVAPVAQAVGAALYDNENPPSKKNPPKASKRKPGNAPRRPLSAYNLFFSDERERILKEREVAEGKSKAKMQVQEMAKIIGERWRILPDEWRKHYQGLADEDMKRHKEFKKRNPKDPSVPKRPPTAFLLFSNKRRKALKRQYPDSTNSDLSKMLSKTWREAPQQIRQKYMDEAGDLSKVYKADMVVWRKKAGERRTDEDSEDPLPIENRAKLALKRNNNDDDDLSDLPLGVGLDGRQAFLMENENDDDLGSERPMKPNLPSKPPTKKRKTKDPSAPKRPLSAFLAFSNTRRKALKQQYPDATNADLSKMLSKMWREAPAEFRQKFIDDAAELSEGYKAEMAEWRMKAGA